LAVQLHRLWMAQRALGCRSGDHNLRWLGGDAFAPTLPAALLTNQITSLDNVTFCIVIPSNQTSLHPKNHNNRDTTHSGTAHV